MYQQEPAKQKTSIEKIEEKLDKIREVVVQAEDMSYSLEMGKLLLDEEAGEERQVKLEGGISLVGLAKNTADQIAEHVDDKISEIHEELQKIKGEW